MRFSISLLTVLSAVLAAPAFAQTSEVVTQERSTEVIITAQKRPEPLSHAPLSVAVVSGTAMQKDGARDLKDLQQLTPSLFIISTANEAQTTARLRGVGTVGDNPGLESSVGVAIDGVYRPRTATAMSDLGELDRIEILKGPQSDVYGKGASAGFIQVVTKLPDFTPSQSLELTAGNMGARGANLYVTGPLGGNWAGSLNLTGRRRNGQYHVDIGAGPRTKTDDNDQNYYSGRGQLLYQPNGGTRLRLIADYTRRDEACCAGVAIAIGGTRSYIDQLAGGQGTAAVIDPEARQVWENRPTDQRLIDGGVSAQLDLALSDSVQFTSVSAWRRWDHRNGYDADFTGADIYYRNPGEFGNRFDTWSQEVRLNGKGERLDWMLGVFADTEDLTRHDETIYGRDYESYLSLLLSGGASLAKVSSLTGLPVGQSFVPGQGNHDTYEQNERNLAVFTHEEWRMTDTVSALVGLRYNQQSKLLFSAFTNSDSGIACAHATASQSVLCLPWSNPAFNDLTLAQQAGENAATGSFKLRWQVVPQVMTYVSYSTGWKGAGYNLDRQQNADYTVNRDSSFKAERSRSYEIGMKGRWFENRLAVDLSAFSEAFRDFQLNTFLGTTFVVDSVPHLRSKGVELDTRYHWMGLALNAGVTYDDAKFGPEQVPGLPLIANGRASFAPKWSAAYGADYSRSAGQLDLDLSLNAKYNSAYNTGSDLNPIKLQKAYTLVDGRAALSAKDGRWSLELWGRNLTNATYKQVAFSAPFQSGTFDAFLGLPRTFGIALRLRH
ncbi:MAG: TonB-dependent receptor [Asticcacaulis sp.]